MEKHFWSKSLAGLAAIALVFTLTSQLHAKT